MLVSDAFDVPKRLLISSLIDLLHHTHTENASSAHVHLSDSYALIGMDPIADPAQTLPVARKSTEVQSSEFSFECEPAMEREIHGFLHHKCFTLVPMVPGLRTLPRTWLFSRK